MRPVSLRRRGLTLLLVVVSMAIVGGMISLLAAHTVRAWESGRSERLRTTARAVAESAAEYIRLYAAEWQGLPPAEPLALDVSDLLPPGRIGSVTLTFTDARPGSCRVSVVVSQGEMKRRIQFEHALGR